MTANSRIDVETRMTSDEAVVERFCETLQRLAQTPYKLSFGFRHCFDIRNSSFVIQLS